MTVFAAGLADPEGPFVLPDGRLLVVEMGPRRGCVTEISADGSSRRVVVRTGRPNAVVADATGALWVAESFPDPCLLRIAPDRSVEVISRGEPGRPFLFPNDLVFGPDGLLYLTDSGIRLDDWVTGGRIRRDYRTAPIDGRLYQIDTRSGSVDVIDDNLRFANGIAVAPDGEVYVNEMVSGLVYRYAGLTSGRRADRESFAQVIADPDADTFRGPDGMRFGADGRLYCTVYGQGDVTVTSRDGRVLDRLATRGALPSNIAFRPGRSEVFVTECEHGTVELLDVSTDGAPTYLGPESPLVARAGLAEGTR